MPPEDKKNPSHTGHEKGASEMANEWPTSYFSPYPPRRMGFKGFPILFAQCAAVKIGKRPVHPQGVTNS